MGTLLSVNDAPATIASAKKVFRFPLSSPVYGQVIGEFTRSKVEPDVDVYDAHDLLKNTEVFVALYPSFLFFDHILDSGNVTIEVLDDEGNVYPSNPVALSSTALALHMIKFTTGPVNAQYFYRLTPESGLVHGEYLLADNAVEGTAPPFAREGPEDGDISADGDGDGDGRRLQSGLDGEVIPFVLQLNDVYGTGATEGAYTDLSIGGAPFSTVSRTVRLGYISGGSIVKFSLASNSSAPAVQRVFLAKSGGVIANSNLTLFDGSADFQLAIPEAERGFLVLRFDETTSLQVVAQHTGVDSNIATDSCIVRETCPASAISITGLEENDLVAIDIKLMGRLNNPGRVINFVDSSTGTTYGNYFFTTGSPCPTSFVDSGVIFAPTTRNGAVHLDTTTATSSCEPRMAVKANAISLNEYLGIDEDLNNFTSSSRSICANENCTSGSLEFTVTNVFAAISNLTVLVQGLAGSRLILAIDNEPFYNESFSSSCTREPETLHNLVVPFYANQQSISIDYELEEPRACTGRQNLLVGVIGFTEGTAAPNIAPPAAGSVDDLPLVAGLSTMIVLAVLGSLLLLFYRSSVFSRNGQDEVVAKEKEKV